MLCSGSEVVLQALVFKELHGWDAVVHAEDSTA